MNVNAKLAFKSLAIMSQSIPTGYIPRATPGKMFLSDRIPATRGIILSNPLPRGKKMMVDFRGGKIFPNSKIPLQKILKKLRKLRDSANFLFRELNKTIIF